MSACTHHQLRFDSELWGRGQYVQPSNTKIQAALRVQQPTHVKPKNSREHVPSRNEQADITLPSNDTFPGPLVEKDDELYHDPKYPPQSVQECLNVRNEVTAERRTIYVVPPPEIAGEVGFMAGWQSPHGATRKRKRKAADASSARSKALRAPQVEDLVQYLQAFYYPLPVKVLKDKRLRFARWDDGVKCQAKGQTVREFGLEAGKESVRIRCRLSPDELFNGQLNLNDILDVAMEILPKDAHALLMLVHHDLYEDEEDDFCCGRAYGGSRIAVVSSARYHPQLDAGQHVDREHSWPASHCGVRNDDRSAASDQRASDVYPGSAIAAGVDAFTALPSPTTGEELSTLWLGRVCKTASHELGHCFGIDHCTFYACIMQGTASIAEDSRQPPYLCPVDMAKVLRATGVRESEHYRALLSFCEQRPEDRMFAAFAAWIGVVLPESDVS